MMISEAKKRANKKYNAKHMTILGCSVRKEYAEEVKAKAKEQGTNVNAILKKAIDEFMKN